MSLSWLDRLTLFVHPQQVVLERRPWRAAASRQRVELAPATGEADWQPAVQAATSLLDAHAGKGAALRIVVADPFVRYAVLPWSDRLCSRSARLAVARALLRNTLGDKAAGLEISLDRPSFGCNGLAAGIDGNLLAALRAAARARRLRLSSLQPRLIAEMAARHKHLGEGWFACLDQDWLSLVGLHDGQIASLRNHRAAPAELAGLLAAEAGRIASRRLFVSGSTVPQAPEGWEMTCWPSCLSGVADA